MLVNVTNGENVIVLFLMRKKIVLLVNRYQSELNHAMTQLELCIFILKGARVQPLQHD